MQTKTNVLVIAPFLDANNNVNRPAFISKVLSDIGCVDIITTDFDHTTKKAKTKNDISFARSTVYLKTLSYYKNVSLRRLISHLVFSLSAFVYFLRIKDKYNVYYVTVPFNLLAYLIALFARHESIVIIDIIDIWPDALPFSKKLLQYAKPIMFIWKCFFICAINRCNILMSVSDSFLNQAKKHLKQDSKIARRFYIGSDEMPVSNVPKEGVFTIVYIGNIGTLYDFETLLKALSSDDLNKRWQLYVVGDGDNRDWLISQLNQKNISYKYFGIVYEPAKLADILAKAHLGFNGYKDTTSASFSYKANTYLAAGLPIVNSMRGDLFDIVERCRIGINYTPGDAGELVNILNALDNAIIELMSIKAKQFFDQELNRKKLHTEIRNFLIDSFSQLSLLSH